MRLRDYIEKIRSENCRRTLMIKYQSILDVDFKLPENIDQLCLILNALSSDIRLLILYILAQLQEVPICLLASMLKKDETLISHHMKHLKNLGLVFERREGKFRYYTVNYNKLSEALTTLTKMFKVKTSC